MYSGTGQWAQIATAASDFAVGDMDGDGRDDSSVHGAARVPFTGIP